MKMNGKRMKKSLNLGQLTVLICQTGYISIFNFRQAIKGRRFITVSFCCIICLALYCSVIIILVGINFLTTI